MSVLTDLLDKILIKRGELHTRLLSDFEPGLKRATIRQMMRDIPFRIPEEFFELYEWRNGTTGADFLFPGYDLSSLDFALYSYRTTLAVQTRSSGDRSPNACWELQWFPILDCGGRVDLAVILDTDEYFAPIQYIDIEMDRFEPRFDSLTALAQTVLTCFEEGVYTWSLEDDMMEMDYDSYVEVHMRYNRHSIPGPDMF